MVINVKPDTLVRFKDGKSEGTVKTYLAMLSKFYREAFNSETFELAPLKNIQKVKKYLEKLSTTSYKLITIATVMMMKAAKAPKELIDIYGKMARHSRIKDLQERQHRPVTDAEAEAHMPWGDILKLRDRYLKKLQDRDFVEDLTDLEGQRFFMKYLTLCLFTMIPPQRGQVYFNCYIDKRPRNANYIDTKKGILHIKEHKTKRSYGDREIRLPPKLVSLIKDWRDFTNCESGLLLCDSTGNKMSTQAFTQFVNSTFDRKLSTDMIRKIYTSHMYSKGLTEEQQKQLAYLLVHSWDVSKGYYVKDFKLSTQ